LSDGGMRFVGDFGHHLEEMEERLSIRREFGG
jgi:hypothetical protein